MSQNKLQNDLKPSSLFWISAGTTALYLIVGAALNRLIVTHLLHGEWRAERFLSNTMPTMSISGLTLVIFLQRWLSRSVTSREFFFLLMPMVAVTFLFGYSQSIRLDALWDEFAIIVPITAVGMWITRFVGWR